MPDYFTHLIAAEKIYENLSAEYKNKITDKTLYLLGAQGGDVFFFYGLSFKNNAGRYLHRMDASELFEKLCNGDKSYAAGWAAHYALDSSVHPLVYAYENSHKGTFIHQKYERDLGLFVSRKTGMRRRILPREQVIECTPVVCDSIKNILPYVTASGIANCLKRHFAFSRRVFRSKKQDFSLDCDYSQAYNAFLKGCEDGIKYIRCTIDGNIDREIFCKSFLQK